MQKLRYYLRVLSAILVCHAGVAYAEIHGTITGTTDYVYRMYSKSNNGPALQGNLDYQHSSGFFVGTTLSSFNIGKSEVVEDFVFPGSAQLEITPYLGWSFKLADDWRLDAQYSRYIYNGLLYSLDGDYSEFYLFLHYKDMVSVQFSASDDFYGLGNPAFFYELTGRYPLTDYLEFSSTFGYAKASRVLLSDYPYWNVGLTGRYKFIALDLRYYDAHELPMGDRGLLPDHPNTLKESIVFSISLGF